MGERNKCVNISALKWIGADMLGTRSAGFCKIISKKFYFISKKSENST
jgi:hypothetical protein